MNEPVEALSKQLVSDGVSVARLCDLSAACRNAARQDESVLMWLALSVFFGKLASSIDDRPVQVSETDAILVRIKPLLGTLIEQPPGSIAVERQLRALRDLF